MKATAAVQMPARKIYDFLGGLTDRLVAALSDSVVNTEAASEVGAQLVSADFTGERALTRTVEVLARTLPMLTAEPPSANRLIELLSALVSG